MDAISPLMYVMEEEVGKLGFPQPKRSIQGLNATPARQPFNDHFTFHNLI